MKVFSAQQIRLWDAFTILHEAIPAIDLMERAARACYKWIRLQLPLQESNGHDKDRAVKIFCGRGNNGGDGLAIARMFLEDGIAATVYIPGHTYSGSDLFQKQLRALQLMDAHVVEIPSSNSFPFIKETDIVIDALFGTGLNKPLQGLVAELVTHINKSNACVVSIDMPSGLYADESSKALAAVRARYTLSFQSYKLAFLLQENESFVGQVFILDIGLHGAFEAMEAATHLLVDLQMVKKLYKPRTKFAHKGNFGHALLVAGSFGKMGAAVLAAQACLRSGVGLLSVVIPDSGYVILQSTVPEAMAMVELGANFTPYAVAGVGPGLGLSEEAADNFKQLLQRSNQFKNAKVEHASRLVIDADALNILAKDPSLLADLPANTILTPHPKEFERLFGASENDLERCKLALAKAAQYNCYIILKGHHTLIACPGGQAYFNSTGNAGMATGGSGDVLTGLLTGLACQGYSALETCLLGVYLHGLAGDKAAVAISQEALIAGDLVAFLGPAFLELLS